MNDVQIKCFLAAAVSQSFAEAAEKLYMTPPTFGRHISALERELGYPLFLRGWKRLRLTAAGELMYEGFQEIIEKFQSLQTEVARLNSGQTGQLTVGILEGQLLDDQLRTVLRYFREAYPDLPVKLLRYSFRAMEEALLDGSLDVGITPTAEVEQTDDLDYKPFCTLPNYIVLPKDHPLASGGRRLLVYTGDSWREVEAPSEESLTGGAGPEGEAECDNSIDVHPYYIRFSGDSGGWLDIVPRERMGEGVVTMPVSVKAMHNWASHAVRFDPEVFFARLIK